MASEADSASLEMAWSSISRAGFGSRLVALRRVVVRPIRRLECLPVAGVGEQPHEPAAVLDRPGALDRESELAAERSDSTSPLVDPPVQLTLGDAVVAELSRHDHSSFA